MCLMIISDKVCDGMTVIPSRDGMTLFGPYIEHEYDTVAAPNVILHPFISK